MIRLRAFQGFKEWNGKWSDKDNSWTNALRQMLQYAQDEDDGTFWMGYEDWCRYFNHVYLCRMVDDRWTRHAAFACFRACFLACSGEDSHTRFRTFACACSVTA